MMATTRGFDRLTLGSDAYAARRRPLSLRPLRPWQRARPAIEARAAGWALTVVYVMLGWVWFLMPDVPAALRTFATLFGQ
jgi:hypothetical protein